MNDKKKVHNSQLCMKLEPVFTRGYRDGVQITDEPTGALNKQNSLEVMDELNRINKDEGTSIMLVTHDMKVAARCERVLYIEDGDIKDEFTLGKWDASQENRNRERDLDSWLIKMGW